MAGLPASSGQSGLLALTAGAFLHGLLSRGALGCQWGFLHRAVKWSGPLKL